MDRTPEDSSNAHAHAGLALARIVSAPELIGELTRDIIPALLMELAALRLTLAASLENSHRPDVGLPHDHLLTVEQAAQQLSVSRDWLYRHSRSLPFVVRQGRLLRFSAKGIDEYLRCQVSGKSR